MILILLLLPAVLFGASDIPAPDPSEVLVVYNSNSTLDTDMNGVVDHFQIITRLINLRGSVPNLLGIPTSISYNTDDHPQSIHIDKLHYDFDTGIYGQDAAVSLPAGEHYILQDIAAWFEADSANRWGKVKYIELLMGMPLTTRQNDRYPSEPYNFSTSWDNRDSTVRRPLPGWISSYLAPGTDQNGSLSGRKLHKLVSNPYTLKVWRTRDWVFTPGTLWAYTDFESNNLDYNDSLKIWVLPPTILDGNIVTDVLSMLSRSESRIISPGGGVRENLWAVIDQASGSWPQRSPYRTIAGFADSLADIFGTNILVDDDSSSALGSDTVYLGWAGDVTLQDGDTCAFYSTAASKHNPRPSESSVWFSKLTFPIANGAIAFAGESFSSWTVRDTSLRPNSENTQTLACEAIHEGFTYAIGYMREPTTSFMVKSQLFLDGINTPHVPWACIASVMSGDTSADFFTALNHQQVSFGPAIGYFRPALTAAGGTNPLSSSNCGERCAYSATMPSDADSLLFTFIELDGDTVSPTVANGGRFNVSPNQAVNYTIGTKWISTPKSKVIISIKQADGTLNTTSYTFP